MELRYSFPIDLTANQTNYYWFEKGFSPEELTEIERLVANIDFVRAQTQTEDNNLTENEYNIKKISVLKINIEGSEYDLLDSLTDDDFDNIDQIAISFHDWMIPEWKSKTERAIKILKSKNYDIQKINDSWGWYLAVKNKSTKEKINKLLNSNPLPNFDWGWMNTNVINAEYHKNTMYDEIFNQRIYERFFEVEEGDIVFDIGSSVGPFTKSILGKKPKHVFCVEPSSSEFKTLVKNTLGYPVTQINKGIGSTNGIVESNKLFGGIFVLSFLSCSINTHCKWSVSTKYSLSIHLVSLPQY